ncbi:MAG: hypothetical protein WA703_05420, partial [Pseudolabrys sp.]
ADFFNAAGSTGSFRKRLPVAAKIALVIAGTIAEVPAYRMECRVGCTVFKAFVDVWPKLRFPKPLYVQHCDVSHDFVLGKVGSPPGCDMKS